MLTGETFGRYEIRGKIGEGGMGEVYSAIDLELDRNVAIKLLPNEFTEDEDRRTRFRQEAKVVSALNHPNVITIYEIGENDFGHFLATEYVEGRTLREIIKRESLTLQRILRIVEQAANALVAAHNARIVHRDIKPENIMVRRDGIVKVLDFGLAKPVTGYRNEETSGDNKTIPGTVMGSARYMSPEQARGHEVDERTDIWSLGVVLYELLVGKAPFDGPTTADTLGSVIYHEPEPIGDLLPNAPHELQRIVRKALQKDREERYQHIKDFALDIKELLHDIEHSTSGNRTNHIVSNPDISENPTIIHRTVSGQHATDPTSAMTSAELYHAAPPRRAKRSRATLVLAAILGVLVFAIGGYALYTVAIAERPLAASAFLRPQISRVDTDGKVMLPAISPDGKYLAYVSGDIGSQSLVVRQISTDSIVTVVPPSNVNFYAVSFSPNGDRVYYTQMSADFSINTLYTVPTLGGTPKKLIEDVDSTITFSPDGKRFAFMRHTSQNNEDIIFTVDATTMEMQEVIRSKQAGYDYFSARPAWSPTGDRILIGAGKREGGFIGNMVIGEIDLADRSFRAVDEGKFFAVGNFAWYADGSGFLCAGRETQSGPVQVWQSAYPDVDFHQVTNDFNDYAELGLSVDGKTIVTIKGETNSGLWKYNIATKAVTPIAGEGRTVYGLNGMTEAADGSLYFTSKEAKEYKLWKADPSGKNLAKLTGDAGTYISPNASPDGRFVVYVRQKDKTSKIWRMNSDGTNPVQLSEADSAAIDFAPQVTPDGRLVVFQRQHVKDDRVTFVKVPIEGGPAEVLFDSEGWSVFSPKISPDGKRLAFGVYNVKTYQKRLQVASLQDYKLGAIEKDLEYNLINQFAWSPDGKDLTILTTRSGTPNIWRQPLDGGAAAPITDFRSGRIYGFAWGSDGRSLLLARGNTVNDLLLIRDTGRTAELSNMARSPRRSASFLERLRQGFSSVR
jgi:eukaryotic-like serine/threonine-protein kinase